MNRERLFHTLPLKRLGEGEVARMVTQTLGEAADYLVQLGASDLTLRLIAPASQKIDAGQKVFALAHPDHCVVARED